MNVDKLALKLNRILFKENYTFSKVLWRMSKGSRLGALKIVREVTKHYDLPEHSEAEFEEAFDQVCADQNDGLEVEWLYD